MLSSLLGLIVMVIAGFATLATIGLIGQKQAAVSLLGVAVTAGISYVLVLVNPAGAGELSTLWPLLVGLSAGALASATASCLPDLPSPVSTQPGERVVNAATTSPQAVAAQPAPHWALG